MKMTLKMRVRRIFVEYFWMFRQETEMYIRFSYSFTPPFRDEFLENFTFHTDKCETHACMYVCECVFFFFEKRKPISIKA